MSFHGIPLDTPEVDTPEWLELRRQSLGASDVAAALGFSPYASPYSVWAEKTGELPPRSQSPAMRLGRMLEGPILDEFESQTGHGAVLRGRAWRHPTEWWATASPDAVVEESLNNEAGAVVWFDAVIGLAEAKTDFNLWEEPPDHVRIQAHWQMYVTGTEVVWVPLLAMGRRRFEVYEVKREEQLVQALINGALDFWQRITEGDPPPLDGSEATRAALEALHPAGTEEGEVALSLTAYKALGELTTLKAQEKAVKGRRTELENVVKGELGDAATGLWAGREVVTWRTVPRKGYTVEPTEYRRLVVKEVA